MKTGQGKPAHSFSSNQNMENQETVNTNHSMPKTLKGELLELAYKKGFQTMTEFWNHIFREYVEKEKK